MQTRHNHLRFKIQVVFIALSNKHNGTSAPHPLLSVLQEKELEEL